MHKETGLIVDEKDIPKDKKDDYIPLEVGTDVELLVGGPAGQHVPMTIWKVRKNGNQIILRHRNITQTIHRREEEARKLADRIAKEQETCPQPEPPSSSVPPSSAPVAPIGTP